MRTVKILINKKKNSAFYEYFHKNTADSKCMYNIANFYIRNTMTAIKKSPEERTHLEIEVMHYVFTGIRKANDEAIARYKNKLLDFAMNSSMQNAVNAWELTKKQIKQFKYPTSHDWFLSYETLDAIFKYTNNPVYKRMNSQVNQKAIRKIVDSWTAYFKSLTEYKRNPYKYTGKPRIPKYLKGEEYTAAFTNQTAKLKTFDNVLYLAFVNHKDLFKVGSLSRYKNLKYVKTEVKPEYHGYTLLITFDDNAREIIQPQSPSKIMGIDVGIDNLFAVGNNFGATPFVIKGGAVKSLNHNFNKQRAKLISSLTKGLDSTKSVKNSKQLDAISKYRDCFLRDYFYKCAWYICRFAMCHSAEVIVLGQNKFQKQEISLGTQNNQNFVSIPYYKFQSILRTVASECGIYVIAREESYTSKSSLLDMDNIPTYNKNNKIVYSFSGKRIHRGLYRSKNGTLMNADINGACNIIRKEFPNAFKDLNLEYLYKQTDVIKYTDLYTNAKSVCSKSYNGKKHKAGISSVVRHRYKKYKRTQVLSVFGKGKYIYSKEKAA